MSTTPDSTAFPLDVERVLFVHAHPDDETIVTGATLATLVDAGAAVTLVTCTRGELGEVIPDDLAALRDDPAALAVHREGEIAGAMAELGVQDHRFLGEANARAGHLAPRAYRDSGMVWGNGGVPVPVPDLDPTSFCAAEFGEIVADLVAVVEDVRPDAIVSYDTFGGYGHPDHVRVNRASLRAARLTGVPYFAISAGASGEDAPENHPADVVARADVSIDGAAVLPRKVAALRRYRSQVTVVDTGSGPALEFPHGAVEPVTVVETFRHVPEPQQPASPLSSTDLSDYGLPGKIAMYVLAVVVGGLFGAIGTVAHQNVAGSFPYGVILALLVVTVLVIGFRLVFETRLVGIAVAIGLTVVNFLLSSTSGGGSVLVPGNAIGYAWIGGAILLPAIVLIWPKLPPRPQRGGTGGGDRMNTSPRPVSGSPDANGKNRL
ncbi:PIG-L family deacetylase [Frondihabitans australicus]|uniref:LmbE family N-acetylglucosaminyl deacetylase n=1 Tax=Frondihabitans australicus TaxID=386892 RepID=A0A495IHW8_9MICO|nr:PIG-L family deacetylase [Frondihabitans australicus]RKR74901.1 LmbE family N-acetylglucosaminyl deacetylase [Frondihabitans australicus]